MVTWLYREYRSGAIDVTLHQVPADPRVKPCSPFEVDIDP